MGAAAAPVVFLGRSDGPPLRLRGALAGRELFTLREAGLAAGVEVALWRREAGGWAVSLQIDAIDARPAHAAFSDSVASAARFARRAALTAITGRGAGGPATLAAAAAFACRRFARARLARTVADRVEESVEALGRYA